MLIAGVGSGQPVSGGSLGNDTGIARIGAGSGAWAEGRQDWRALSGRRCRYATRRPILPLVVPTGHPLPSYRPERQVREAAQMLTAQSPRLLPDAEIPEDQVEQVLDAGAADQPVHGA